MLDEKDLQAIASLIDTKLFPIQSQLSEMQGDIVSLKSDVSTLKSDVVSMKSEMHKMQGDIEEIKETLSDHTVALNELLAWADDAQVVVKIPFGKVQ